MLDAGLALVQTHLGAWSALIAAQPVLSSLGFFLFFVAVTALSLPLATLLSLLAGYWFGLGWGLLLVSFATSTGALLAMLLARHALADWVRRQLGSKMNPINQGMDRQGAFYLFALRLTPAIPYFMVNALMGLTTIRAWTFYWVSQLGMLPLSAVYVNAGEHLAQLRSTSDVASPALLLSLALVGLVPLVLRYCVQRR